MRILCIFAQQRCEDEDFCATIDQWNNDSSTGLWRRITIEVSDTVFFCFCPSVPLAVREQLINCFIETLKATAILTEEQP
jgi:hypothetical protein